MYLEISGRQTGKTARLVDAVEHHLTNPENVACVTTVNHPNGRDITRRINARYHNQLMTAVDYANHVERLHGRFDINDSRVRFFWDEFDFARYEDNVIPMKTGYYCTTAKFNRTQHHWEFWKNDPLLCLLVVNNFMYTSHHGMKSMFPDMARVAECIKSIGVDAFNHEYMTGFDKAIRESPPHIMSTSPSFGRTPVNTFQ